MNALHLARACFVAGVCLVLAGCPSLTSQSVPPSVDRAEQLVKSGDRAGAARVFEQLATETSGSDQNAFLLRAAREWFAAGRADDGDRVLARLPATLPSQQALERQLLRSEGLLARNRGEDAWRAIESQAAPTNAPEAARYFQQRGRVALATDRFVEAVRAQISRERFLAGGDRTASRTELLAGLRAASERGTRIDVPANADALVRGWLEAGPIAAENARNAALGAARIAGFRARFPNHPALEPLAQEPTIGTPTGSGLPAAAHVALLLPTSGRAAGAGTQIRDGFLTAYYAAAANNRPRVRVYDTSSTPIANVIAEAQAAGAEFIVGPLTREEVVAVADLVGERPPILALNFLPAEKPAPDRFYQFALSPEDEARAVARRLVADGRRRGVVLAPGNDWGSRVATAFGDELRAAGGQVIGQSSFDAGANDFGASIMQVMRTSDSRARYKRIEGIVGQKLEFEPRRRPDIQFIFAPAQAATARLLRPQLKFHLAGEIPTYTLADAYEPGPANAEMDGLLFPDMPWMLGTGSVTQQVRGALSAAYGESGGRRGRLFAFGYDAYSIFANLAQAGTLDQLGLTGRLTLDAERRVKRELDWAQIRGSAARVLDGGGSD
jgi:outer membrane PBP1 activator LpoA protein